MTSQRPHPGPLVKTEIFKPRGLKIRKVADLFKVHENYISQIVTQRTGLNLEMCCRLEVAFGEDADKWALRQLQYDLDKEAKGKRIADPNFFVPKNLPRVHPGPLLKQKIITSQYTSIANFARQIGEGYDIVLRQFQGLNRLSLETCLKLEKEFGENAEYWAVRQMRHDLDRKREEVKKEGLQRWKPS